MPDISMCNQACPDRFTCYRHSASGTKPYELWQSYIMPESVGKECGHYWPTGRDEDE